MSTAHLDWRGHSIGPARPCRICRHPALMRDEHDIPCHKTCAEAHAQAATPTDQAQPSDGLVVDLDTYRQPARPVRRTA